MKRGKVECQSHPYDLVAISKETVANGNTVLPYMAFDKVVISGKQ